MSDMKCPFCQQELLLSSFIDGDKDNEIWNCLHCQIGGKRKLWQELIRTRKELDIAVKALNKIANTDIKVIEKGPLYYARAMFSVTNNALGRIQDIKQKDVK